MRWCQNSRIVEGVHPLFRESDLVPLFHPLSATFLKESTFLGCSRWAKLGHFGPKHAPGTRVVKADFLKAVREAVAQRLIKAVKRLLYVVNKTNDCFKMHLTSVRLWASTFHY